MPRSTWFSSRSTTLLVRVSWTETSPLAFMKSMTIGKTCSRPNRVGAVTLKRPFGA